LTEIDATPDGTVHIEVPGVVNTNLVGVAATITVTVAVPVPLAFVALNETAELPAAVGIPEMTPVPVLMLRPAGSPLAPKLVGVFVAVI
jgi:hypothetical protein